MDKALRSVATHDDATHAKLDWRKKISDHVAFALLIYTGLQILSMSIALKVQHSILPYFALVLLVAAIIPGCRWFEARWTSLPDEQAHDPALAGAFARDRTCIWALAIGIPVLLVVLARGIGLLLG